MKIRELLEAQQKQNLTEFDWNPLHWFGGQAQAANSSTGREDEDGRGSLRPEWGNMNAPRTNDDPAAVMKYYGTPRVPTGVALHQRIPADSETERNAEGLGSEPGEHSMLDYYAKYPEKLHDAAAMDRINPFASGSRDPNYRGSKQELDDHARVSQLIQANPKAYDSWSMGFPSQEHFDRYFGVGAYEGKPDLNIANKSWTTTPQGVLANPLPSQQQAIRQGQPAPRGALPYSVYANPSQSSARTPTTPAFAPAAPVPAAQTPNLVRGGAPETAMKNVLAQTPTLTSTTPQPTPALSRSGQTPSTPQQPAPATQPNLIAGGAINNAVRGANPSETTTESFRAELDDLRHRAGIRQKLA